MGLDLEYVAGQTPLDKEEKEGLLISTIAVRSELDEFEQQNIEEAIQWTLTRSFKAENIFTEAFICHVHRRMFGAVWAWAGEFRKTNKNIGVDKWQIPADLKCLSDDVLDWLAHHTYAPEEIAIRFKHRMVSIHCFANGNGRHSRLMADIVIEKIFKMPVFSWGAGPLVRQGDPRAAYLAAVKQADKGDIRPLVVFARS